MDKPERTQQASETTNAPQAKRAYKKPAVIEFGDVRELTRGGGQTRADGKFTKRNK
jgi:hypothetical protein